MRAILLTAVAACASATRLLRGAALDKQLSLPIPNPEDYMNTLGGSRNLGV